MGNFREIGVGDVGSLKSEKITPIQTKGGNDSGASFDKVVLPGLKLPDKKGQEKEITIDQLDSILLALEGRLQIEIDKYTGGQ